MNDGWPSYLGPRKRRPGFGTFVAIGLFYIAIWTALSLGLLALAVWVIKAVWS